MISTKVVYYVYCYGSIFNDNKHYVLLNLKSIRRKNILNFLYF